MKPADLIVEVIQATGLPDSRLEEGAGITEHARHVPDNFVGCAQIDTCPEVGEGIRRSSQRLLSAVGDRRKKMLQQGPLDIHSSIITFGSPHHPFPCFAILAWEPLSNRFCADCYTTGPEGLRSGDQPAERTPIPSVCSKMEPRNWLIMIRFRSLVYVLAVTGLASQGFQSPSKFEIADVRQSASHDLTEVGGGFMRGGRYLLRHATMLELVRLAFDVDAKKVVGGPNWIELDRFDIRAKVPPGTNSASVKPMLQALLAERFGLAAHRDTKPLQVWALTSSNHPLLKRSDGPGEVAATLRNPTISLS